MCACHEKHVCALQIIIMCLIRGGTTCTRVLLKNLLRQKTFHASPIDPVENTDGRDQRGLSDVQLLLYLQFTMM